MVRKILRAVDLSHTLGADTPVYPGDPALRIIPAATITKEGYNTHSISLGTHTGTHVDLPYHAAQAGQTADQASLCLFAGEGVVVPLRKKQAREAISAADLRGLEHRFVPGTAVLFHTGWDKKTRGKEYFHHPYLEEAACRYLLDRGVLTFGIDAFSIDPTGGDLFPVHRLIATAGGIIVENLANLEQINFPNPFVVFFPLKLAGCDGSPVRAVALQLS